MSNNLSFSIVIPSYNEGDDVRLSIESTLSQSYPAEEILVIDDSSDNTPEIIREYLPRGVSWISGPGKGCCGARNLGIRITKGDVVILLNADVILPPDFLEKIKEHYEAGADYVLVESRVFNAEGLWARFVEMQHRYESRKIGAAAEWTEGFSCRREAALRVGLIPGDFPIKFCRDWMLGQRLKKSGYKKVIDLSIVVTHKAPDNFKEYWAVRKARGRFGSLGQYFLWKKSILFLSIKFLLKDIISFLRFILILPALLRVYMISSFSKGLAKDFFPFFFAYFIQELARAIGEWEGIIKISSARDGSLPGRQAGAFGGKS